MSVNCSQVDSDSVDSDEEREELGLPPNPDAIYINPTGTSPIPPSLNGPPGGPMPGDDFGKFKLDQLYLFCERQIILFT